jgi:uncharacterized membrane protein
MSNHHQWLAKQLPQWVDASIISPTQADALRRRYPIRDTLSLGRLLITGIAAVMIGLGVILLFAYNWADMGKASKLAVIFSALIGAHALALITRSRSTVYSESLFALGTMLMGAGIFLVGQIYHLDSHYPDAFLFWSLGALSLAWALPSLTQAFLAITLVIGWHLFEVFDFHFENHSAFLLILLGIFPLAWRLQSPVLARFVSAGLFLTLGLSVSVVDSDLVVMTLLLSAAALIGLERLAAVSGNEMQKQIAAEMAKPAMLVLVVLMYLMSFGDLVPELLVSKVNDFIAGGYFYGVIAVSQGVFFWLLYRRWLNGIVRLSELAVLLALLPTLLVLSSEGYTTHSISFLISLGFNLILLAMSVWLMVDGARNANRQHMVRGSILFALLAAARYTDLFDSLVTRAVVFLLVGAALFAVSHFYQRNKKQVGA